MAQCLTSFTTRSWYTYSEEEEVGKEGGGEGRKGREGGGMVEMMRVGQRKNEKAEQIRVLA